MEQMAPDLDSQMTGAGSRRHWRREEDRPDRGLDGDTVNEGVESKTAHTRKNKSKGSGIKDADWYFIEHGEAETSHRFTTDDAPAMYEAGKLSASTLVWADGFTGGWLQLQETALFATCLGIPAETSMSETKHREIHMHSNPMNAPATPAGTTTQGEDETEEQEVNALSDGEHRAANRLGVLYGIYKPACFYFDIINIFHVRLFAP